MEDYKKLLDGSVELYRTQRTIAKLETIIQKNDDKIKNLQLLLEKEITSKFEGLSPVSSYETSEHKCAI